MDVIVKSDRVEAAYYNRR